MNKTIKQIAEEIGVSKQAVHQKIKKEPLSTSLKPFTSTVDGVVYISIDGQKLVKSAFNSNQRQQVDVNEASTVDVNIESKIDGQVDTKIIDILNKTIETLQQQLIIKDDLIQKLQNELSQEHQYNMQKDEQILNALSLLATAQAADKQKALADTIIDGKQEINKNNKEEKNNKTYWWQRKK